MNGTGDELSDSEPSNDNTIHVNTNELDLTNQKVNVIFKKDCFVINNLDAQFNVDIEDFNIDLRGISCVRTIQLYHYQLFSCTLSN